jgi:neutral ceramidase
VSVKRKFTFKVRHFDEAEEEAKVTRYCAKYAPGDARRIPEVFREMRKQLAPRQGETRETWIQAMFIGDVAIVGVPAEYFAVLGMDIKKRSPFKHTYVAELANDWIGYLPDREAHALGGYQTWMGQHSYAEVGTGERVADEVIDMLKELKH